MQAAITIAILIQIRDFENVFTIVKILGILGPNLPIFLKKIYLFFEISPQGVSKINVINNDVCLDPLFPKFLP